MGGGLSAVAGGPGASAASTTGSKPKRARIPTKPTEIVFNVDDDIAPNVRKRVVLTSVKIKNCAGDGGEWVKDTVDAYFEVKVKACGSAWGADGKEAALKASGEERMFGSTVFIRDVVLSSLSLPPL